MKPWIALAVIVAAGLAAVVLSERHRVDAPVSPAPIFHFVGDAEHELTRVPVTLTRMSDEQEIEIGDEMAKRFLSQDAPKQLAEYDEISSYVNTVGTNLAQHAQRKLPYRFHYIPQDGFVNAFALPGGHVFIGKGLLNLMETEDELANVLGHEIEHIDLRHCAERAQIESGLKKIPLGSVVGLPIQLFEAGYSKEQELAADREGTKLAFTSGYSPQGAISMFQRFQKLQDEMDRRGANRPSRSVFNLPLEVGNVVVLQSLQEYFRTHPPNRERIAQIQRLIADQHWGEVTQKALRIQYVLLTDEAERYLAFDKLDKASAAAQKALASKPNYPPALNVLGEIAYDNADFAAAAEFFRKSLQADPRQDDLASRYALSLSASVSPQIAVERCSELLTAVPALRDANWFLVQQAGLKLMAGDAGAAKSIEQQLAEGGKEDDPALLARLGWWYYRSGDLTSAADLIGSSLEQRPQYRWLNERLGWVLAAQKKYETAQQHFYAATGQSPHEHAAAEMGIAVSAWNQNQPDLAITNYRAAVNARAAWKNLKWVGALYGQQVAAAVQAMQVEDARRRAEERKRKTQ